MPSLNAQPFAARPDDRSDGLLGRTGILGRFVHRPVDLKPDAALVVTLHGCTQTAEAYARGAGWVELADQEGFVVLALEQTRAGNANLCFNWFLAEQAGPQGGEILAILAMIDEVIVQDRLDPARVFVTGLSAGGAMAFALLMSHPERFAGGGVIAGLPFGMAEGVAEALGLMRSTRAVPGGPFRRFPLAAAKLPKLSIWHGLGDKTVAPGNADLIARQWRDVAGLPAVPDATESVGIRQSQVWTDASGDRLLEVHSLAGFGHAAPISAGGPDGLGKPGPHIVDCGQSSTRSLAQTWGLTAQGQTGAEGATPTASEKRPDQGPAAGTHRLRAKPGMLPRLRDDILAGLPSAVPKGVRDFIDRSLRQAGL